MKKTITNLICRANVYLTFAVLLPFVYGCGGGGGGSAASVGSVFTTSTLAYAPVEGGGSDITIATVHNPEPMTLLLLGGGMLAMGFVKNRKRS